MKVQVDEDRKMYERNYRLLKGQLEDEKEEHELTIKELENLKKELAKLKECPSEEPENSITIDDMISIIGEQATPDDAKTISEAIKTILMEKDMNLTAEQKRKMKAYLAKVGSAISVEKMFAPGSNYYEQKK